MLLQKLIASLVLVFLAGPALIHASRQEGDKSSNDKTAIPEAAGPALVLTGARILTLDGAGAIENGSIVIVGGKIQAVGQSVEIPDGAKRIDCSGMTITPGLIDSRSRLWLDSASAAQSGGAASLDVVDGLDPFGEDWIDVVRGGVTSVYLQPSGNDVCAGVGAVISAAPRNGSGPLNGDSLNVLKHEAGLQAALGVGNDQSGKGRAAQFDRLKKLFTDAKKYQDEWKTWNDYQAKKKAAAEKAGAGEAPGAEGQRAEAGQDETATPVRRGPPEGAGGERPTGGRRGTGGRRPGTESPETTPPGNATEAKPAETGEQKPDETKEEKPPTEPKPDPVKDRLVKVLTGDIPVHLTVNNPDDSRRAMELAKEFGLRLILDGLVDTGASVAELRDSRFPMVLGPWFTGSGENDDLQEFWREKLCDWDGRIAIASFGGNARASRGLRSHAAMAVAAGCDADRALAAVTIDAARVLGVSDQTGSIAPGKRADLVLFAGDPLDLNAAVQMTIIQGEVVFENEVKTTVASSPVVDSATVSLPEKFPDHYSITSSRMMAADGSISQQSITVRDGMIVSIDTGNNPVTDIRQFDFGNAVVSPGLFVAHSSVGISSNDFKANESDARHLSAEDGYDPTDRAVSDLAASGVLMAVLVPPSQNTLAGRAVTIRLMAKEPVANDDSGDKFVLSGTARNRDKFPASMSGQRDLIQSLFAGAPAATRVYLPEITRQLLVESRAAGTSGLLAGNRLAIFEATTDAEVRTALDLIESHKLRAAIVGIENVGKFVDRLVATKSTLIVNPVNDSDQLWRMDDLISAANAGVSILWTGDSGMQIRRSAALAVAAGMNSKDAMSALIAGSSRAVGNKADFVVWSGMPTDLRARPLAVIVDGQRIVEKAGGGR